MLPLVILLVVGATLWGVSFRLSDYELLSPAPLIFLGFNVSILLAIVGLGSWNRISLSLNAVAIIITGYCGIFGACAFIHRKPRPKHMSLTHASTSGAGSEAPIWRIIAILSIVILANAVRVYESYMLAEQLGLEASSYAEMSKNLRRSTSTLYSTDAISTGVQFSFLERQLEKVVNMSGFAASYLMCRSLLESRKCEMALALMLLAACSYFLLASGSRGMLFYWIISFFICLSILQYNGKDRQSKLRISTRIVVYGCLAGMACALFMYSAAALVGRKANSSLVEYVSFYFGGSAPSLQLLLDAVQRKEAVFTGPAAVFYGVSLVLFRLNLIRDLPGYSLLWVNCGNHMSNIFTCFGRYYVGFGYGGVLALSFLATLTMLAFYRYARSTMTHTSIALTGLVCSFAFDSAREEFVFSRLFGSTYIINLFILGFLIYFLTEKQMPFITRWEDATSMKIRTIIKRFSDPLD